MEGILIPQQIFVGDTAEFLFPVDSLSNFDPSILTSGIFQIEKIKQNDILQITEIKIKRQGKKDYISIGFIPWESGALFFPSLKEVGIYGGLPQIYVSSILETMKTDILQPPRPPILLPGTTELLYAAGAGLVLCGFIVIGIIKIVKNRFFSNSFSHSQKKRMRTFYKNLKRLERKSKKKFLKKKNNEELILFGKSWLKEFEDTVRIYCFDITDKININGFNTSTYSEILFELRNRFENSYGIYFEFEKILSHLQELRFGNSILSDVNLEKECINFLAQILNLVKITESEIRKKETTKKCKRKAALC